MCYQECLSGVVCPCSLLFWKYLCCFSEDMGGWIQRDSTSRATCSSCSVRGHSISLGLLKGKNTAHLVKNFCQKRKSCMICEWGLRHWAALKVSPIKASKTYFMYLLFLCPAGCFMGWNLIFLIHISVLVNSTRGFQLCSPSTCFWCRRPRDTCCAEPGSC